MKGPEHAKRHKLLLEMSDGCSKPEAMKRPEQGRETAEITIWIARRALTCRASDGLEP
jgi:hypothetical protein